jgi:hypothetical protein
MSKAVVARRGDLCALHPRCDLIRSSRRNIDSRGRFNLPSHQQLGPVNGFKSFRALASRSQWWVVIEAFVQQHGTAKFIDKISEALSGSRVRERNRFRHVVD